jgi:hypothetical protein
MAKCATAPKEDSKKPNPFAKKTAVPPKKKPPKKGGK